MSYSESELREAKQTSIGMTISKSAGIHRIRFVGGIHTNPKYLYDISEDKLAAMIDEMSSVVRKYISTDAWLTVQYTKSVGHKINS